MLIVNADDFGLSPGVNLGIIEAHRKGIVTSASLMVRWPAAVEAVALSRENSHLSVGLHVDLGEWICRAGSWSALYEVVPLDDRIAVEQEIRRQLECFRDLTGRDPTHLDSHQHVHRSDPARTLLQAISEEISAPLRHFAPHIRYCGSFYGQTATGEPFPAGIAVKSLIELFHDLPPGITELGCHPAFDLELNTMYRQERLVEVESLCDPRIHDELENLEIELCSFYDVLPAPTDFSERSCELSAGLREARE